MSKRRQPAVDMQPVPVTQTLEASSQEERARLAQAVLELAADYSEGCTEGNSGRAWLCPHCTGKFLSDVAERYQGLVCVGVKH